MRINDILNEGLPGGEYSRVLTALKLYYPGKFSMQELNTPEWHRVIANKADVPTEYAGDVIDGFVKASQRNDDDEDDGNDEGHDYWEPGKGWGHEKDMPEGLNEFSPAGSGGGNTPRGPRTPGRDPWGGDDSGEDPYSRPEPEYYSRSIDYFGRFEADHFDDEEFDKDTGVFKGYWDDAEGRVQIGYFKFDDPEQTGSDDPGMGWYYEPQNESVRKYRSQGSEQQLDEILPALAAGAGALARGAAAVGRMAAPTLRKVPGAVKTVGQAIGRVPGAVEKVAIQGLELLNDKVPGGIFNPDGSLKGSQYLTKYLSPQEIQQAQQHQKQGVAEGSEELYGLKVGDTVKATVRGVKVQGDVIDIFPETQQVELLLRGANAGKTITIDVQDTESLSEQGMAEGSGDVGNTIRQLYQQFYDQGDDALEYLNTHAPLFAQFWDQYEGDLDSIIAEVSPKNLIRIAQELKQIAGEQGVAEGIDDEDYGPELAALQKEFGKFTTHYDRMDQDSAYAAKWRKQNTDRLNQQGPDDDGMGDISAEMGQDDETSMREGKPREKEADYGADYQDMVARVKKLAGLGPLKTVYDPQKRVYKNVPRAEQPKK